MECSEARLLGLDRRRGTMAPALTVSYDSHLAECVACQHEDAAERALTVALRRHLSLRRAPSSLRRQIEAQWLGSRSRGRAIFQMIAAMAVGAALSLIAVAALPARAPDPRMVEEAVNDHLRLLSGQHPLEVESTNMHQVVPWFSGKLDFAPLTAFAGDEEFPLQGGLVGYFIDRKAAILVFKRRLHTVTLLVFAAQGLRWPFLSHPFSASSGFSHETSRGFHVVLWRRQDLGYALVSDTNDADLMALAGRIAGT